MADKNDVASIEIRSGVNERREPFNTVVVKTHGGQILLGQISPAMVRTMALDWLGAAEASETDAIIWKVLAEQFDLEDGPIAAVISMMRGERG